MAQPYAIGVIKAINRCPTYIRCSGLLVLGIELDQDPSTSIVALGRSGHFKIRSTIPCRINRRGSFRRQRYS